MRNLRVFLRKPASRNEVLASYYINDDLLIEAFGPKAGMTVQIVNLPDGRYQFLVQTTEDGTGSSDGAWFEVVVDRSGKLLTSNASASIKSAMEAGGD